MDTAGQDHAVGGPISGQVPSDNLCRPSRVGNSKGPDWPANRWRAHCGLAGCRIVGGVQVETEPGLYRPRHEIKSIAAEGDGAAVGRNHWIDRVGEVR